jgi:hypothetical protein
MLLYLYWIVLFLFAIGGGYGAAVIPVSAPGHRVWVGGGHFMLVVILFIIGLHVFPVPL